MGELIDFLKKKYLKKANDEDPVLNLGWNAAASLRNTSSLDSYRLFLSSNFEVDEEQVDSRFAAKAVRAAMGGEWRKTIEELINEAEALDIDKSLIDLAKNNDKAANLLDVHIDLLSETIRNGSPINYQGMMLNLEEQKDKEVALSKFNELYGAYKAETLMTASVGDEILSGYGPFGLCATNPIPTENIAGSNNYLGQLILKGRQNLSWERLGSTSSDTTDGMIDIYQIKSDNTDIAILYICPYHKKNSERPPDGFLLKT